MAWSQDVNGLIRDAKFDPGLIADLALSAGAAVVWWFDFSTADLTWMPGLDEMVGLAGADEQRVRDRLAELIAPLTVAARAAPVWQDFDLEQPYETPDGDTRWVQFRARVSVRSDNRSLVGIATD